MNAVYPQVKPGVKFVNDWQEVVRLPEDRSAILPAGYIREIIAVDGELTKIRAVQAFDDNGSWLLTSSVNRLLRTGRIIK